MDTPEESQRIREQALAAAARVFEGTGGQMSTHTILSRAKTFEAYLRGTK